MTVVFTPNRFNFNGDGGVDEMTPFPDGATITCTVNSTVTNTYTDPFGFVTTTTTDQVLIPTIISAFSDDPGIKVTFVSNTFTVTGMYTKAFIRVIEYLDNNLIKKVVPTFGDLPTGLGTLHKYIAPTETHAFKEIVITFDTQEIVRFEIIVRNNYQSANAALKNVTLFKDKF